jgi:type IX secretion system PorP/SprF family membrane protein
MKNLPDFFFNAMRAMLLAMASVTVYGQQGPQFTQFMFNNLAINPAFAGADEALSMTAVSRTQWSGIEGAPVTTSFSAHDLVLDRVGLGLTVVDDRIGVHSITSVMGSYAYHLRAGRSSYISMGVQGGVTRFVSDYPSIAGNSNDPKLAHFITQTRPDIGAGIYFRSPRLDAGLSALGLLTRRMATSDKESTTLQNADFLGYLRYRMKLSETLIFEPATLIKYFPGLLPSIDVNGSFIYRQVLTAGVSYRSNESVDFLFKLQLTSRLQLGYSYDHPLKSKTSLNRASHEVMVNYVLRKVQNNVASPR